MKTYRNGLVTAQTFGLRARISNFGATGLTKQPRDRVAEAGVHQFAGLVEVVKDDGARVDAEGVIDGGQQLHGVDRVL